MLAKLCLTSPRVTREPPPHQFAATPRHWQKRPSPPPVTETGCSVSKVGEQRVAEKIPAAKTERRTAAKRRHVQTVSTF